MQKPFKHNLNYDVDSKEKVRKTDEELIDYMLTSGELDAADRIRSLMIGNQTRKAKQRLREKDDIFNKKMLSINQEILDVLKKIKEGQIDEQDTAIKDTPKQPKQPKEPKEPKQPKLGTGFGTAKKPKEPKKQDDFSYSGPGFWTGAAVLGSAAYVTTSVISRHRQSEMGSSEAEREAASAAEGGGLAGAALGAIAGAKAMGIAGALIGSIVPGLGNIIGGVGGVLIGGAAGAALGYYMGDSVGEYIATVWSTPLERLKDADRENPFTLHSYLTSTYIPSLNNAYNMATDPEGKKDILKGINEYTDLAKEALTNDFITEWMTGLLERNGLKNADAETQTAFLNRYMSGMSDNKMYYDKGIANIPNAAKGQGTFSKFTEFLGAKEIDNERLLKEANEIAEFNKSNTFGVGGNRLVLSKDAGMNFDELVKAGIVIDEWGENSLSKGAIEKLRSMPLSVLSPLLRNGNFTYEAETQLRKLISEKYNEERREETAFSKLNGTTRVSDIAQINENETSVDTAEKAEAAPNKEQKTKNVYMNNRNLASSVRNYDLENSMVAQSTNTSINTTKTIVQEKEQDNKLLSLFTK